MEGSNTLYYSPKFPWVQGRFYSKVIEDLGKLCQKRSIVQEGSWAVLTVDHVQWQVLLL